MAADKTNNLTAFLTDIATTIRTAEGTTDPIDPQDFSDRIEALPETVRPDVDRAETTLTVTADDTNDKLTFNAANNQGTGYVTGANKTASTTVTLVANGKTVTATASDGTQISKDVGTVGRANTAIATIADDTADTLTVTASNNQGTGYVTGSNKTASTIITLSVAKPTIDTNGNVTAVATIANNTSTPVSVSKASETLALGAKTSEDLSVSGAKVSVPAGYYPSNAEKSIATATRANTSITVTADDTADTLKIDASNNQTTGYVTGANKTATTTVTLTASGATVTATETGGKTVSKSVTTASRAKTTLSSTKNTTNNTLDFTASNNQSTGYVTGSNSTATKSVSLSASGATVTASDGTNSISKSVGTVDRAATTLTSSKNTTNNTLDFTASNNQGTGYVTGANKTATKSVSLSTNGATVTASDGTNSISTTIASGSYSASGGGLTAGATTVAATSPDITLGTATTTEPSGKYIKVTGSGVVNRAAITKSASKGYVSTGSATVSSATSATSTPATLYYPISSNIVDTSAGDATALQILDGKKAYVAGTLITGKMDNCGSAKKTLTTASPVYDIPSGYHDGGGEVKIVLQNKEATPSTASQTINADEGKVLKTVTVKPVPVINGFIGGTASNGSAKAAINNVNGMNTIASPTGTAGTDYFTVKATATGTSGGYTPKYTVNSPGYLTSSVTGDKQTVTVTSDSTGESIHIPKAVFTTSGAAVQTTKSGGGYVKSDTTVGIIPAGKITTSGSATASATVTPGSVTVASNSASISGKTRISATPTTYSSITTPFYIAIKPSVAAGSASISGSGTATAKGSTAGYITTSTSATGSISVSGTATSKQQDGLVHYLPIVGASFEASGNSIKTTLTGAGYVSENTVVGTVAAGKATTPTTAITATPTLSTNYTSGQGYKITVSTSQIVVPSVEAGYISRGTEGTITVSGSAYVPQSSTGSTTLNAGQQTTIGAGYYPSNRTIKANSLSDQTPGNAATEHILSGKSAWVNGTKIDGGMANRGAVTASIGLGETYTIPPGYHDGNGKVTAANFHVIDGDWELSASAIYSKRSTATITQALHYEVYFGNDDGVWGEYYEMTHQSGTGIRCDSRYLFSCYNYSAYGNGWKDSGVSDPVIIHLCESQVVTTDFYNWFVSVATQTSGGSSGENIAFAPYSPKLTYSSLGTTYGFTAIDDGYYESNNKGKNSSYALGKFSFTAYETTDVVFEVINYAEGNYDYAIFSTLDKTLTSSTTADTSNVKQSFKGKSNASVQTLTYSGVSAGTHYITVKFIKDSSSHENNDSVRLRLREPTLNTNSLTQIVGGDREFVASNIKSGVNIYGVTGTYTGSGGTNVSTGTLTITDAADKTFRIIIPEYSNGTFSTTTHYFYGDGAGDVTFTNVVRNMPITWMAYNSKLTTSTSFSNKFDDYVYDNGYYVTMVYNLLSTSATVQITTYDCCFAPESQVLMADGSTKAIVDVEIGDKVLTYNETSGAQEAHEVTTLGNVKLQDFTQITMANGNTIEMNKYHPLYTTDGWKSLTRHRGMPELTANDKLLAINGDYIDIDNIDTIKDMELKTYYTLKVANNNNFYVNGYLAQGKDKD